MWTPSAALILGSFFLSTALGQEIHMKTRTFSPTASTGMVANARTNRTNAHQIVAFNHPVGVNDLDALNQAGVQVTGVLPDNAVVVSGVMTSQPAGVVFVGAMESRDKVSPKVTANPTLSTVVVEFHSDVDAADQAALESSLGIAFLRPAGLLPQHVLVQADSDKIALLSQQDEVAYIFPADPSMLSGGSAYPCAGMLTTAGSVAQYANIMHGWSLDADGAAHLSYYFGSLTAKVPAATVQSEILRAFAAWASRINVTFQPAASANLPRSISISFASGAHGDAYPFDGPGGMLGHTFYPAPINSEPIAGNMHFDADEAWGVNAGIDIYTVALHEIGHALGLSHSDDPNDVMYPYYQPGRALSANDIGAALELYPAAGAKPATLITTTAAPTTPVATPTAPATPTAGAPSSAALALVVNAPASTTKSAAIELTGTLTGGKGNGTVQWQTDHGYSGGAALTASGSWTSAGIPLVTGANTITVLAYDAADQVTTKTEIVTLQPANVTATAPVTISIASPVAPVVTVKSSTLSVSGKASGGAGITSITWQTSNGATGTACGTDTWVATGIPVPQGNTTVMIKAHDASGASAWVAVVAVRQ
ncbi:MAG TPA: matrixin family metalloprotease [Bryobacteraceae bacterium]|nr:matrixin family metalloprotease [Bryobacteraceae bacterium]